MLANVNINEILAVKLIAICLWCTGCCATSATDNTDVTKSPVGVLVNEGINNIELLPQLDHGSVMGLPQKQAQLLQYVIDDYKGRVAAGSANVNYFIVAGLTEKGRVAGEIIRFRKGDLAVATAHILIGDAIKDAWP